MSTYTTALNNKKTPQSQPIPGKEAVQVKNNAGGYVFQLDPFDYLDRFLILGSDGPTYYTTAPTLTAENCKNLRACLQLDWKKTIDRIVEISVSGRAPKNDAAIFALAVAATPAYSSQEASLYALEKLPFVCRIGTHLFQFVSYIDGMRGWGRALRRTVAEWYTGKNADQLAYQLIKYQSRTIGDGGPTWSHKDVLRLAHPQSLMEKKQGLFAYAVQGNSLTNVVEASQKWGESMTEKRKELYGKQVSERRTRYGNAIHSLVDVPLVIAYESAKAATKESEIVKLIEQNGLTREMIPTQWLNSAAVWEALLIKMPLNALVRNLGKMTSIELLKPLSAASKLVVNKLSSQEEIHKSRLHPMSLLIAAKIYGEGHGFKGKLSWTPVPTIKDALEEAFYAAFKNCVPTDKNIGIFVDVSGSMTTAFSAAYPGISSCMVAAVLAMVAARTEKNYAVYGFSTKIVDLGITAKDTLVGAMKKANMNNFGGTDCALAFKYAEDNKLDVDAFLTITDNETWAGKIHPVQALKSYRSKRNKPEARAIFQATTATGFSIADPNDKYMLDIVGFDAAAPTIIADFIRGKAVEVAVQEEE